MDIRIDITPSQALTALFERAARLPMVMLEAMGKTLNQAGPVIVGDSLKHRFTAERGPFPPSMHKLGRVTGRLRQSITNTKAQINPAASEVTMGFGSNVSYFRIHEFGFSGVVSVRAHRRRNGQQVKAHQRKLQVQAREPMQAELRDPRSTRTILLFAERNAKLALDKLETP